MHTYKRVHEWRHTCMCTYIHMHTFVYMTIMVQVCVYTYECLYINLRTFIDKYVDSFCIVVRILCVVHTYVFMDLCL
jgi:hypothetical protein